MVFAAALSEGSQRLPVAVLLENVAVGNGYDLELDRRDTVLGLSDCWSGLDYQLLLKISICASY